MNLRMQLGRTAFKIAADYGRVDCMRLLAERGADMHAPDDVRDNMCTTSDTQLRLFSNICMPFIFMKTQSGETALMAASSNGHIECVRLILDGSANANVEMELSFSTFRLWCAAKWRDIRG